MRQTAGKSGSADVPEGAFGGCQQHRGLTSSSGGAQATNASVFAQRSGEPEIASLHMRAVENCCR